jgi:hypothetical protein
MRKHFAGIILNNDGIDDWQGKTCDVMAALSDSLNSIFNSAT